MDGHRSNLLSVFSAFAVGVSGILLVKRIYSQSKVKPLPPGPKGNPIIKNLFDLPSERQWECVAKMTKEYGNIIYFSIAGQHMIFLNDVQTAIDLLEKRSSIYSDRIQTAMIKLMDVDRMFSLTQYGDEWRRRRRMFHQEFNSVASHKYMGVQLESSRNLVSLLRNHPDDFQELMSYFASGIILESIYGFQIKPIGDPYVDKVQKAIGFTKGLIPYTFLVDAFPFLRYFPSWIPGSGFIGTRPAKVWRNLAQECTVAPFEASVKLIESRVARPSFISSWLSKLKDMPEGKNKEAATKDLQDVAVTAFLGGYETTSSILLNFVLAMLLYPDVQAKAQKELDRVIGQGRLPEHSDKMDLPYVIALYKEILRWQLVAPLGVPHGVIAEDEYMGMRIPKDSVVISNIWAMSRNEKEYGHDVEAFNPDRFLQRDAMDPSNYVFGFGRRICPGRHLAETALFISLCHILHLFTIERAVDENGRLRPLNPEWVSGVTVHLKTFPASFKLRFGGADRLIDLYCQHPVP